MTDYRGRAPEVIPSRPREAYFTGIGPAPGQLDPRTLGAGVAPGRVSFTERIRRELTAAEDKADHLRRELGACADLLVGSVPRDPEGTEAKVPVYPSLLDELEQRLGRLNWTLERAQQELARLGAIS